MRHRCCLRGAEQWERLTGDTDVVGATVRSLPTLDAWSYAVDVPAMEHVRADPLEARLRHEIARSLREAPGVEAVEPEDEETWLVRGGTGGEDLMAAVCAVLDANAEPVARVVHGD